MSGEDPRDQPPNAPVLAFSRSDETPDSDERRAASDPRWNVALEASAGTGKTTVLVSRYVRLIEEGVSPRHILAITFTRKAAAEMKARILTELRARREIWRELRDRLFEIHVTTIDAFCLGLLREFPLEAGLDPDIELMDEVDGLRLMERVIDESLTTARRSSGSSFAFLVDTFGEAGLRRGVEDFLRARLVRQELIQNYVERVLPRSVGLESSLRRAGERLVELFRGEAGIERFLATGPGRVDSSRDGGEAEDTRKGRAIRVFDGFAFAMKRAANPSTIGAYDLEEIAAYFLTSAKKPRQRLRSEIPKRAFDSPDQFERHRDQVLALAPSIREIYVGWYEDKDRIAVRTIWRLYQHTAEMFQKEKSLRAGLDFTDVLENAVGLLERRGEFSQSRFRLESRYHHLLIDEFQDTNEMQWRLIRALIESWGEGAGLVQEAILSEQAQGSGTGLVREPTIFIVGDRKQSIYGFRDARVEVMDKATRQILRLRPRGGHHLKIRKSFRAAPELLHFLNDLFFEMPKSRGQLPYSFRYVASDHFPLPDPATNDRKPTPAVGVAVSQERLSVAFAIAHEIHQMIASEEFQPRDIAILFRSRTHYQVYEQALSAFGIPSHVYRGLGFFDAPEVRDIQALVRYLAEPNSELRAAELGRSRIIWLSDDALYRLANQGRQQSRPLARWLLGAEPPEGLPIPEDVVRRIRWASIHVQRWVARTDREPAAELIQEILDEVDYAGWFYDAWERPRAGVDPSVVHRDHNQVQGWENLKKMLELVRKAQNRGYLTMSRLAEFLDRASLGEESLAIVEAAEAVNLMTIHASKGLEFESVFVVNMEQRTGVDRSLPRIQEQADGSIAIRAIAATEDTGSGEQTRSLEEEKRLLYVAATRARRRLVLSATLNESPLEPASLWGLLPESFRRAADERSVSSGGEAQPNPPVLQWESRSVHRLRNLPFAPPLDSELRAPGPQRSSEEATPALLLEPLLSTGRLGERPVGPEADEMEGGREDQGRSPRQMKLF